MYTYRCDPIVIIILLYGNPDYYYKNPRLRPDSIIVEF